MKIMVLGGDGYLGWPTAMHFALKGHSVCIVDNYSKRRLLQDYQCNPLFMGDGLEERIGKLVDNNPQLALDISVSICDITKYDDFYRDFIEFSPDTVIHYAEQPSGPYSMLGQRAAEATIYNNLITTNNLAWAVINSGRDCHIIKLGTMGEYGNPAIASIPEGYQSRISSITKNGLRPRLFPREAGSLYHTTKILDTDLLKFYCNNYKIRVTDLMQGPVYGLVSSYIEENPQTHFYYDDLFGTVVNRFVVQAMVGEPLTIYGNGTQKKGYITVEDVVQCIDLVTETPAAPAELRVFNQVAETLTVADIAEVVIQASSIEGYDPEYNKMTDNVRGYEPGEDNKNYEYEINNEGLKQLGFTPTFMTVGYIRKMISLLKPEIHKVNKMALYPRFNYGG